MKLKRVTIENYRAVKKLDLPLHPRLTVFHGDNAHGKTSVLSAIAVGLGRIPRLLPDVSGIGFLKTDRRESKPIRVVLTTTTGISWQAAAYGRRSSIAALREAIESILNADRNGSPPRDLPIVAFYDENRAVFDQLQRLSESWTRLRKEPDVKRSRYAALQDALSARTDFKDFFEWFYTKENEELRWQRRQHDFGYRIKDLDAVRRAIESMVPDVSEPRIEYNPFGFMVSVRLEGGGSETPSMDHSMDQLSGGYRIVLALAADLARRMAQGNPHREDPLQSEAVVLIDEVELHLHPAWQQRVLPDLLHTFPNAQFIVSTHSPQVLTTVKPEQVIQLYRQNGGIVAGNAAAPTYGAEAGYVLAAVMDVDERPGNEFTATLKDYMRLVSDDLGESEEALSLKNRLEELSPRDPALHRAAVEIRRRKLLKSMGRPPG